MRQGQLKQRLTWKTYSVTNSSGQAVPTYATQGTYWADVQPLNGREGMIARQLRADVTHVVKMFNVGSIKPKDRFTYKNRTLEVASVLNVDELDVPSVELNIVCVEVIQ